MWLWFLYHAKGAKLAKKDAKGIYIYPIFYVPALIKATTLN